MDNDIRADIKYIKKTVIQILEEIQKRNKRIDEKILVLEESRQQVEQEINELKRHCVA